MVVNTDIMTEVGILKYNIKFLFVLVLACIVSISAAAETVREYEIVDTPFMLHGKPLSFGEKYTPDSFEKKFGKSTEWESYPPGAWYISYYDEGITIFFTEKNTLKGIRFDMNVFNKVTLYDITVNRGDSYQSIRKKLEAKKKSFSVTEYPKQSFRFRVNFFTDKGDYVSDIDCLATGTQEVISVFYFREY